MTLLLLLLLAAAPAHAQDPLVEGTVTQQVLPELNARADRAKARTAAAEEWFRGELVFEQAWPALAGAPVLDPAFLKTRRAALARNVSKRASERVAADGALSAETATALAAARAQALDLEERADQLEDRLLAGLEAGLERALGLSDVSLQPRIAALTLAQDVPEDASAQAMEAAAEAQKSLLMVTAARRAAVRAMTIPGDPALGLWAQRAAGSELSVETALTLQAVEPLLTGAAREASDKALAAARQVVAEAADKEILAELARLEEAQRAVPSLGPAESLDTLRADVQAATTAAEKGEAADPRILAARLALAERRLAVFEGKATEDSDAAQQRADAARQAAEETAAAGFSEDEARKALRARVVAIQAATAEIYDREAARRDSAAAQLDAMRTALEQRMDDGAAALSLPLLDPQRRISIDTAYLDLRASVGAIYEGLDGHRVARRAHRRDSPTRLALLDGWSGARGSPEMKKLDDAHQAAATELREALASRERTVKGETDELYRLLDTARDARRELKFQASSAARAQARRDFLPELAREMAAIPGQVVSGGRVLLISLFSVPAFLTDLTALTALMVGSFELVILLGLWGVLRRQMGALVVRGLDALETRTQAPLEGDRAAFQRQLTELGVLGLDVLTGLLVLGRIGGGWGFFGLLAWLWVGRAMVRAAPLAARCAFASPEQMHPSLRLVTGDTERLAARSLYWVAMWLVLSKVGTYAMVELLDADRLRDVVAAISSVAFWGLVLYGVVVWGPMALAAATRPAEDSPVVRWLRRGEGSTGIARLLHVPRYALAIAIVSARFTAALFTHLIEGRAGLGWLQSAIARRQLKADDEDNKVGAPLDEAEKQAIRRAKVLGIPRTAERERLAAAHTAWKATGRRGLVSIIGQDGAGKSRLTHTLSDTLGTEVVRLKLTERITEPEAARRWLSEALGLGPIEEGAALAAALEALEPRVISLDDAHLLFLRRVGGYGPLQAVIEAMTSTADRHFWVLCMHQPAWDYLMGIAARLKLDAFRDHIRLAPSTGPELATWLEGQARTSGIEPTYDKLATTGLLGGDEELAEKRARSAFWRLLSDASNGVPDVAVELWIQSLRVDAEGVVHVRMFDAHDASEVQDLGDELLFALTALVQHHHATAEELGAVLNRRPGAARAAAKHLESLDLVTHDPGGNAYSVDPAWNAAVQRLLRQKHFLHAE